MRAHRVALLTAAALSAAGAAPAAADAGSWTAPRAATSAGSAFGAAVAADNRGRFVLGFERTLGGVNRVEVRHGLLRDGALRGPSATLDSSAHNVDSPTLDLADGAAGPTVVWQRYLENAQRLRGASLDLAERSAPSVLLTAGSESGYEPRFTAGADGVRRLVYDRRTRSATRDLTPDGFGPESPLPGTGISSSPQLIVAADGSRTVAWLSDGKVLTAGGAPGSPFGTPVQLPSAGYAREVQLVQGTDGTAVAAWTSSQGQGKALQIAVRPPAGGFGAPVTIAGAQEGAFAPHLVATSAGEILLAWIATGSRSGYASSAGTLRLQRLTAAGVPVGAPADLSPQGTKARGIALAHDGAGSVIAAWGRVEGGGRRTIQARRIAPGGILGAVRTLSPAKGAIGDAPQLACGGGDAVAAWASPAGRIVYSVYR